MDVQAQQEATLLQFQLIRAKSMVLRNSRRHNLKATACNNHVLPKFKHKGPFLITNIEQVTCPLVVKLSSRWIMLRCLNNTHISVRFKTYICDHSSDLLKQAPTMPPRFEPRTTGLSPAPQ
eukprot:359008-Chlamydomonas_euryale.AAC.3